MSRWILVVLLAFALAAAPAAQRGSGPPRPPTAPPRGGIAAAPPSSTAVISIEQLELAADRIQWEQQFPALAQSSRQTGPTYDLHDLQSGPSMDIRILSAALQATGTGDGNYGVSLRVAAVRALGRMENPSDVANLAQMLGDSDAPVRAAAARALAQCLWRATDQPYPVRLARIALEGQLVSEVDKDAKNAMYEALGSLHYGAAEDLAHVDLLLRTPILTTPMMDGGIGALAGYEALTRRHPGLSLDFRSVKRLRELAVARAGQSNDPQINALRTLQNIQDNDVPTIAAAAQLSSVPVSDGPLSCDGGDVLCGFEFRVIGVQMLNPLLESYADAFDHALHDAAWQVRYEALTKAAVVVAKTGSCALYIEAFEDRVEHVARHAIELLTPSCLERKDLMDKLHNWAMQLSAGGGDAHWQIPVTALETQLKFNPADALKIAKEFAAKHQVWQVRAAAARIAGVLADEDLAVSLAQHDSSAPQSLIEANVRTAALNALRKMSSPQLPVAAIAALSDPDDLLVYTAATLLKDNGTAEAVTPLVSALARVSKRISGTARPAVQQTSAPTLAQMMVLDSARDSSRDARLALLATLGRLAQPGDTVAGSLRYLLTDTDPAVASAAADVILKLGGSRASPRPTKLTPVQPADNEIANNKPRCAAMLLDNGKRIDLAMAMNDAPIAAARFLTLATNKFYDGLTFHRVEVNSFVQGGSPDANELSTGDHFIRDEIGLPTGATSVALVTRGLDTGAGQFFLPLLELPRINHDFTIFATFTTSARTSFTSSTKTMPPWTDLLLDAQIVEGTRISSIREVPCQSK